MLSCRLNKLQVSSLGFLERLAWPQTVDEIGDRSMDRHDGIRTWREVISCPSNSVYVQPQTRASRLPPTIDLRPLEMRWLAHLSIRMPRSSVVACFRNRRLVWLSVGSRDATLDSQVVGGLCRGPIPL